MVKYNEQAVEQYSAAYAGLLWTYCRDLNSILASFAADLLTESELFELLEYYTGQHYELVDELVNGGELPAVESVGRPNHP